MDEKKIDLEKSVFELVSAYPELKDVLAGLGFDEICKPGRLQTMGRFMTLPKGCAHKGLRLEDVVAGLEREGFSVSGAPQVSADAPAAVASTPEERRMLLKSLLERLQAGEAVEDVKDEFVASFKDVESSEIAAAEQELISGGVAVEEVQRLCDVHATLFEGHLACGPASSSSPSEQPGHPVWVLREENAALSRLIGLQARPAIERARRGGMEDAPALRAAIGEMGQLAVHYKRKEELVFPFLERHDVTAPSKVMWGKDDEVRALLKESSALAEEASGPATLRAAADRFEEACEAADSMVFKEENILFPLALDTLNAREWLQVSQDSAEYGYAFIEEPPAWRPSMMEMAEAAVQEAEAERAAREQADVADASRDGKVHLSTGEFTAAELEAVLNTIPLDMTFVDKDDKTRYFSHGEHRFFARPQSCLGRDVYDCHPPKSQAMVRQVFDDFRSGARDSYEFWIHMGERFLYIRYFAVRDGQGNYLGALETTQDIAPIQAIEGDNRRGADVRREEREAAGAAGGC